MTEVYRTPDARFDGLDGYSFEPHYVDLDGDMDGLRMHYVDEGAGDPILLLHGEPTWAYLYRKMIGPLAGAGRVIAPDYIGFGRSDKVVDRDWYSYDRHVDSIVRLIELLDLRDITVVVQDWGGPIGLRTAVLHPDRFARLVILNTGLFDPGMGAIGPAFEQWRDFARNNPDLPIGFVLQSATTTDLTPEVVSGYEAPFPNAASKAGPASFPLLVPTSLDDPGAKEIVATKEALTRWEKPALVAFSDSDPIFKPRGGERLAASIPGAVPFVLVEGGGHFLQEDRGEPIAEEVARFIAAT